MAQALQARGTPFMLHYTGRRPEEMAYRDRLAIEFPQQLRLYFSRVAGHARMDIDAILRAAAADAVIYVCGPAALIGAVVSSARKFGIAPERVQFESFT
jgi:ferredoxin-NADP reductase